MGAAGLLCAPGATGALPTCSLQSWKTWIKPLVAYLTALRGRHLLGSHSSPRQGEGRAPTFPRGPSASGLLQGGGTGEPLAP